MTLHDIYYNRHSKRVCKCVCMQECVCVCVLAYILSTACSHWPWLSWRSLSVRSQGVREQVDIRLINCAFYVCGRMKYDACMRGSADDRMNDFSASHLLLLDTDDLSASYKDDRAQCQHPHCGSVSLLLQCLCLLLSLPLSVFVCPLLLLSQSITRKPQTVKIRLSEQSSL